MIKGGYKIIDLKNTDFTLSTPVTISGIYEAIENSYGKALMISGYSIAGVEQADAFVQKTVDDGDFVFVVGGNDITVTPEDAVTIAAIA